jgi:hypothetical protein
MHNVAHIKGSSNGDKYATHQKNVICGTVNLKHQYVAWLLEYNVVGNYP